MNNPHLNFLKGTIIGDNEQKSRHGKSPFRFQKHNSKNLHGSSIIVRKVVTQALRFELA